MAKIELLFGNPTTEKRMDEVEEWACHRDVNIETANIQNFKALMYHLTRPNKDGNNYFELSIYIEEGVELRLPRLSVGTYVERGFTFPKLVIHGFYAKNIDTQQRQLISDKWLEIIGRTYEDEFYFEYYGFGRIGKAQPLGNELIYMLRNKPHIYHSGSFIEVLAKKN
jgi:hypothetical protein